MLYISIVWQKPEVLFVAIKRRSFQEKMPVYEIHFNRRRMPISATESGLRRCFFARGISRGFRHNICRLDEHLAIGHAWAASPELAEYERCRRKVLPRSFGSDKPMADTCNLWARRMAASVRALGSDLTREQLPACLITCLITSRRLGTLSCHHGSGRAM